MKATTIIICCFLLVGCFSTHSFTGTNTLDPSDLQPDTPVADETATRDQADKLLAELISAKDQRRRELIDAVVEIGEDAIPSVENAEKDASDPDFRMALLYIRARIAAAADPALDETDAREVVEPDPDDPTNRDTGPDDPPFEDQGYDEAQVERFLLSRYRAAYEAHQAGDQWRTVKLCEAILTLSPHTRYRDQVRALLLEAKTSEQQRLVAGSLRFDRKTARYADQANGILDRPLAMTLFIKNLGDKPILIDFGSGEEPGTNSLLALEITLTEESALGDSITTTSRVSFPVSGEKIKLAPDASYRLTQPLQDLSDVSPGGGAKSVLTTLDVKAELRPARMTVLEGEEGPNRIFRPIVLTGTGVIVMPSGFPLDEASHDPVVFLTRQLAERAVARLFLVAPLIAREDYRIALDLLLADDLDRVGLDVRRARLLVARRLTGKSFASATKWREWWQSARLQY